jgi:hypothetical protein
MPIPSELSSYADEADFIQRFLFPLLQRLGFTTVAHYHGAGELGKDLVFAEVDRFGMVRYHALQAKFEASIGLNEMRVQLVEDCHQAFSGPFRHPQTGQDARISSFYGVNAGSISEQSAKLYFDMLLPKYGGNVHLLQGKDLLALDRNSVSSRADVVAGRLAGMLAELEYNRRLLVTVEETIGLCLGGKAIRPTVRLRGESVSAYLAQPMIESSISLDGLYDYWAKVQLTNRRLDSMEFPGMFGDPPPSPQQLAAQDADEAVHALKRWSPLLEGAMRKALSSLGPVAAI